ncbi:hypothetical protein GCM10010112_76080 [Actinoplanes lobatus]|uniref:Uncharacterized protein n=1 Tax=Actinoplanes lobatus TaxID=113568 RepID=A0ABQ4ATQ2_9ACTN|nr:hypothetical protein GCM10010112_76080 [Actinoplanes lobatus]GIE43964.1 hypothetical protein Alo02nite_68620 [Actinoplanes lobatus]
MRLRSVCLLLAGLDRLPEDGAEFAGVDRAVVAEVDLVSFSALKDRARVSEFGVEGTADQPETP